MCPEINSAGELRGRMDYQRVGVNFLGERGEGDRGAVPSSHIYMFVERLPTRRALLIKFPPPAPRRGGLFFPGGFPKSGPPPGKFFRAPPRERFSPRGLFFQKPGLFPRVPLGLKPPNLSAEIIRLFSSRGLGMFFGLFFRAFFH